MSRGEAKRIRGLGRRRVREREGRFIAEGVRVVEELLAAGIVPELALISSSLEDTERGDRLARRLADGAPVRHLGDGELRELGATESTQGVLVVAPIPEPPLATVTPGRSGVALALDGVQDPGNLGTLARSAAAFGCAGVLLLPGTVDAWNPKAVRASAGALFRLPVVPVAWTALDGWRAEQGCRLLGADAAGEPVDAVVGGGAVLVVGNEGAGLSAEGRRRCDGLVGVPMRGGTESLNVAVAAGILLYDLTRGRE